MIIQGLGGRNKVDAPTANVGRVRSSSSTGPPPPAPPPRCYSMLITRPFDRPVVVGPDNHHYLSVFSWERMLKLPHDERVAALNDPADEDELRTAVENYNRIRRRAPPCPRRSGPNVFVDRVTKPEHEPLQSRAIADLAAEQGKALGRRAARPRPRRGPADRVPLAHREPRVGLTPWAPPSATPRMVIGTSDGGAHLARDDGADWSSYFLRSWVLDRHVWSLGGHPPDHPGGRPPCSASTTGAR